MQFIKNLIYFFSVSVVLLGFAAEKKIYIIEIPLNESRVTLARQYLDALKQGSPGSGGFRVVSPGFNLNNEPMEGSLYCLAPYNEMTRFYGHIQELLPFTKKIPYIPVVYHFIPYLLCGERALCSTSEFIQKNFTKNSLIYLVWSEQDNASAEVGERYYPSVEMSALAFDLRQKEFQNVKYKSIRKENSVFKDHDENAGTSTFFAADLYHKKQWWIDKPPFRLFLRISRATVVALFLIPIFLWMRKNF